jgi:hypothetical protein
MRNAWVFEFRDEKIVRITPYWNRSQPHGFEGLLWFVEVLDSQQPTVAHAAKAQAPQPSRAWRVRSHCCITFHGLRCFAACHESMRRNPVDRVFGGTRYIRGIGTYERSPASATSCNPEASPHPRHAAYCMEEAMTKVHGRYALVAVAFLALTLATGEAKAGRPGSQGPVCGPPTNYYCIDAGTTTLTLSASWRRRISASGRRIVAIAPAVKSGARITFPIAKTGPLTIFRRSQVFANDFRREDGSCERSVESLLGVGTTIHHRGGFAVLGGRRGRQPLDVLAIAEDAFVMRGRDHTIRGDRRLSKGAPALGGELSGRDRVRRVTDTRFKSTAYRMTAQSFSEQPLPLGLVGTLSIDFRVAPRTDCVIG